jgi:hypothetical protein
MPDPESSTARGYSTITLIGGSGRSGTTILRRLLGRHRSICEVPEWRLPVDPDGLVDFYVNVTSAWTPLSFDARYRALARLLGSVGPKGSFTSMYRRVVHRARLDGTVGRNLDVAYGAVDASRFCPNYPELAAALLNELRAFHYKATWTGSPWLSDGRMVLGGPFEPDRLAAILGGFYRKIVAGALRARGAEHYLEKNTWYPLVFDRFLDLVPDARLISISRDPRDVVCSMAEQRWAPSDLVDTARYYRAIMDRWYAVRARLPVGSYLEVNYEELVAHPETELARITDFAGIPLAEGPYGLSAAAVGRWQRVLGAADLDRIAPYIAPELDR